MATWGKKGILISIFLFMAAEICSAQTIYVFYPLTIRTHVIQKKLGEALPGFKITFFGKNRDFIKAVEMSPPDAVFSKPFIIEQLTDFEVKLSGMRKGKNTESYVLLSVDKAIDINKIEESVVGVLDYLGRKGMQRFMASFFSQSPIVKRTTKIEDLLPLLTYNMADSIFISEDHVKYFQEISNMNFIVTPLPHAMCGIAQLAVKKGSDSASIIHAFTRLNKDIQSMMRIEGWQ